MNFLQLISLMFLLAAAKKLKEPALGPHQPVQDKLIDSNVPVEDSGAPGNNLPPHGFADGPSTAGEPVSDVQFIAGGFHFPSPGLGQKPPPNPVPACHPPVPTYPEFVSLVERNVFVSNRVRFSAPRDAAHLKTFTFMVINEADSPVTCQVEMSPDCVVWESYGELEITIAPGDSHVFVPLIFLRFTRIRYKTDIPDATSFITIWFQGQT